MKITAIPLLGEVIADSEPHAKSDWLEPEEGEVRFHDLNSGDCFEYKGVLYIKSSTCIEGSVVFIGAIALDTGRSEYDKIGSSALHVIPRPDLAVISTKKKNK